MLDARCRSSETVVLDFEHHQCGSLCEMHHEKADASRGYIGKVFPGVPYVFGGFNPGIARDTLGGFELATEVPS